MFGFSVLTWNAGYQEGSYSKSINRTLFGGSPGHAAAELVLPITPENKQIIEEVNQNKKLIVQESTTVISRPIQTEPYYEAVEVPCYKIYFSFWGDVSTKKTPEEHRMLDFTKDRIEEGKGIPQEYSDKGKEILGDKKTEWSGYIGTKEGSPGIEHIQHLAGLSKEQIKESKEKMNRLKSLEHDKELLLWHVKEISGQLQNFTTEEQKQEYLDTDRVREIFEEHAVHSIEELQAKLSGMSAALNTLRIALTDLGTEFGAMPDAMIHFSVDPEQQLPYSLDYRAMLREMGRIANDVVPYHALRMNCCTATLQIINKGINTGLGDKLQESGYSLPSSNVFFETPQSVLDYSLQLSSTLSKANFNIPDTSPGMIMRFLSAFYQALVDFIGFVFGPSSPTKKEILVNQRAEYTDYFFNTKDGLEQLETQFSTGKIEQSSYTQLKANAIALMDFYKQKIIATDKLLFDEGYIDRTNDYDTQINTGLRNLAFAQPKAIAKLESDAQISIAIDKIATSIYSRLTERDIYGDISRDYITKIVAAHVEQLVNISRVPVENYNYQAAKNLENSEKLAAKIQLILDFDLSSKPTMVDREVAALFLASYKSKLVELKRKEQSFEKILQKRQDGTNQAPPKIVISLAETKAAIAEQEQAIEKITNGQDARIEIVFPPHKTLKKMNLEQIQAINTMCVSQSKTQPLSIELKVLNKNIRLANKLKNKLLELLSKIEPDHYDFATFEKIRSTFNSGPFAHHTSQFILEQLAQNLINVLGKQSLEVPLSTTARNAVISYLSFNNYIEANKNQIPNVAKLTELLAINDSQQLRQILDDHDKVMQFIQKNQKSTQPSTISEHLNRDEHRFIYLFHKIVTTGIEASHSEKTELSRLIEQNLGNMALNKQIERFVKDKHPLIETYKFTISDLKYLLFKTHLIKLNDQLVAKAENAVMQIEKGNDLATKDQLTLFELGRLEDLVKLKPTLEKLESKGLIGPSGKLQKLFNQALDAEVVMEKIEQQVTNEHLLECGDLVMKHSKKSLALKNKSADTEAALTHTFISQYGHAAQVYLDPETNAPTFSHIWGTHQVDEVRVTDVAISDTFRVDVTKLISPKMQEKLEKYYKDRNLDYKVEVRNLFKANTQKLLAESAERFQHVKNDKPARFHAGLANFGLYGGHSDKNAVDRTDVHGTMYGKEGYQIKDKMICSEFVASSVIAAIFETNAMLKQQMVQANTIQPTENVIRIPLERERIARIHPERLINLLNNENCLERVDQSAYLKKIVNQQQLYDTIDVHKLKSPGVLFYEQLLELVDVTASKEEFVNNAIQAFKTYAEDEYLDIDFESPRMQTFLHNNLSFVHDKIHDNPNCIILFFRMLLSFLGIKSDAKQTLEKTISELEKIQTESILDKYSTNTETDSPKIFTLFESKKTEPSTVPPDNPTTDLSK